MDKTHVPSTESLLIPTIRALMSLGGRAHKDKIDATVIEQLDIDEEIQTIPQSATDHRTAVEYRLAWAKTRLRICGLIEGDGKGTWWLTDKFNGDPDSLEVKELMRIVNAFNNNDVSSAAKKLLEHIEANPIEPRVTKVEFDGNRQAFIDDFSPDALMMIAENDLLSRLFLGPGRADPNLCNVLEIGEGLERSFGSIRGGSSYKFGLFRSRDDSMWRLGFSSTSAMRLGEAEAFEKGKEIRDLLIKGCAIADDLIKSGVLNSVDGYKELDKLLSAESRDYFDFTKQWVRKYLFIFYPDYFVGWYSELWLKDVCSWLGLSGTNGIYPLSGQLSLVQRASNLPSYLFNDYLTQIVDAERGAWWPSLEEYDPSISKEKWHELISSSEIFTKSAMKVVSSLLEYEGGATCKELSFEFGEKPDYYISNSVALARRVQKETNCDLPPGDSNSKWWPVLYQGRRAKRGPRTYSWRLRDELKEALEEVGVNTVDQEAGDEDKSYWWLTARPTAWNFSAIAIGEEIEYTLANENGRKRRVYQNFLDAKVGDVVVGYEPGPSLQIVALLEVSREQDGEGIWFRKLEHLSEGIDFSILKNIPELEDMQFVKLLNGSFFAVSDEEYDIIMDLIREKNPGKVEKKFHPYSKEDFLREVFLSEEDYLNLTILLDRKKNLILQGAPGVGKTFAATRLAYSILGAKNTGNVEIVQFHQNYSYEDFIMGFKPTVNEGFALEKGIFYTLCKKAANHPDEDYFLIIDEINRGNLSKIFGELLMLIENGYRGHSLTLAYNKQPFSVPSNLKIIGMMNTADRGLALIDYALRRRFSFFEMKPGFESQNFKSYLESISSEKLDNLISIIKLLNSEIATDSSLGEGFQIGHSYFCGIFPEECTEGWLELIVRYDILPMLKEYWFDDQDKVDQWENALLGAIRA